MTYRLFEIAGLFLKLGLTAFGGPAAHVALLEQEVVTRRGWMDRDTFLRRMSICQLIPGPNSTELVIHIGYDRGRWGGLMLAGICFIVPAVCLSTLFAALYVRTSDLPQFAPLLIGIKPVILVIIINVFLKFSGKVLWGPAGLKGEAWVIFLCVAAACLWLDNEILPLFGGGCLALALYGSRQLSRVYFSMLEPISLTALFLVFLKVGAILYGSGYVLIAFLETELIQNLGWLTPTQLLDAIAVGQMTPGPLLSTSSFIGYLIADVPGAILAAVGIFLPSFLFVALLQKVLPMLEASKLFQIFLQGILVGSVALIGVVAWQLAPEAAPFGFSWVIASTTAVLLGMKPTMNTTWLLLVGVGLGYLGSM